MDRGSCKLYPDRPQRSPAEPSKRDAASERHTSGDSKQWSKQLGLEHLHSLNWERLLNIPRFLPPMLSTFNNSNRETKVSGIIIATECNIYSHIGTVADKCLRSRFIAAVGNRQGNPVVTNIDEMWLPTVFRSQISLPLVMS